VQLWSKGFDEGKADASRELQTSDAYSESKRSSTAIPLEAQTEYIVPPEFNTPFGRQVSTPPVLQMEETTISPKVIYESVDTPLALAGQETVAKLDAWMMKNEPNYRNFSAEKKRNRLYTTIKGGADALSGQAPTVKTKGLSNKPVDQLEADRVFGVGETASTVPEITDASSYYINTFRAELAKAKANELVAKGDKDAQGKGIAYANEIMGQPQWWQDPERKREMLSKAPEFQGVLGIGVYQYPSGATVESDAAYAARMVASPANFLVGMGSSATAETVGDGTFLKQREASEVGATAKVDESMNWWDRNVTRGLDNVAKNRGVAEEVYDLTDVYTDNQTIKNVAYVAGLAGDVVAMPLVPGFGFVSGGFKGATGLAKAEAAVGDLGKLTKLEKTGYVLSSIAAENPVTKYTIGKMLDKVAPGDPRLLVATRMSDTVTGLKTLEDIVDRGATTPEQILNGIEKELGSNHPTVLAAKEVARRAIRSGEEIDLLSWAKTTMKDVPYNLTDDINKSLELVEDYASSGDRAIKGTVRNAAGKLVQNTDGSVDDVLRWVKTAVATSPDVLKSIKLNEYQGLQAFASEVLKDSVGRRNLIRAISDEQALSKVFKNAPDESNFYLLTSRTAVSSPRLAKEIMTAASDSPVSKAIMEATPIDEAVIKTASGTKDTLSGTATTSKVKLTNEGQQTIKDWLRLHDSVARLESPVIKNILEEVESGVISTQTARTLAGMQVDEVARQRHSGKLVALTEKTISQMPAKVRNRLLTPIELREGWIVKGLKDLAKKEIDAVPISARTQRTINDIQQEIGAMDKTLRLKVKEIMENGDIAKLYGLDANPSKREAMLALIFRHPKRPLSPDSDLDSFLNEASDYTEASAKMLAPRVRDLVIHNLDIESTLSRWFSKTNINLKEWVERQPALSRALNAATAKLENDLAGASSLDESVQAIADYIDDANRIGEPYIKQGFKTIPKSKIEDLLIGLYFEAEKGKILDYHVTKLVDAMKPSIDGDLAGRLLGPALMRKGSEGLDEIDLNHMVAARVRQIVKTNAGMSTDSIDDFIGEIQSFFPQLRKNPINGKNLTPTWMKAKTILNDSKYNYRFIDAIDEQAWRVIDHYGLARENVGDVLHDLEDISRNIKASNINPALEATIKKVVGDSFDASKFKAYMKDLAKRDASTAAKVAGTVSNMLKGLRNLKYTFMLYLRPRFHGANFVTAPFIMMSTIGGETTAKSMRSYLKGAWLAALSSENDISNLAAKGVKVREMSILPALNKVAFTDVAGRSYTWRDLTDIARQGGILRTQKGADLGESIIQKNIEFLAQTTDPSLLKKIATLPSDLKKTALNDGFFKTAQDFAEWSDASFRMSVMIESLKAGEDTSQALQKAREALFDYGRMEAWEKEYISKWFAFYSFQRSAMLNVLSNMVNNPSRLANQLKISKGYAWNSEDERRKNLYQKEYSMAKPLIAIVDGVDKERYATYLPSVPVVDTIFLLAKVFFSISNAELPALSSMASERLDPAVKALLGGSEVTKDMIMEQGYIDPRDVAWLKATGTWDAFNAALGPIEEAPAAPGEPSWGPNKVKYSFKDNGGSVNKKAATAYLVLKNWFIPLTIGGDQLFKDIAPLVTIINPADLNVNEEGKAGIDLDTNLTEQMGLTTDIRVDSPTEIYNKKTNKKIGEDKSLGPDNQTRSTN
jgi:hypothetical protein